MYNIAITGSFASGKSFILHCLYSMGYKVFSCDEYVKTLYEDISIQKIVEISIEGLVKFDKQKLAKIIYNDNELRSKLESIIYPKVRAGIAKFEEENQQEKLIFTEVPLLFESGSDKYFSYNISVFCSEKTRALRAKSRKVFDLDIFEKIKQIQLSQEEKKKRADFIIDSEQSIIKIEIALMTIINEIK